MLKLGKCPARPNAVRLKFGSFFNRKNLPKPPLVFGHELITGQKLDEQPWGILGNADHSDCVFAGAAHEHQIWAHEGKRPQVRFDDAGVLSDYSAVTGFDPAKPETDQGTDMAEAAAYRRKTGILDASGVRHKISAYVALNPGNTEDIALAAYLTGAVGIGLRFPSSAMDQFEAEQPWRIVTGATMEGGHYVPLMGRNRNGDFLVVTWGRVHAVSPAFLSAYMDEGACYLTDEMLNENKLSPEGFDSDYLRKTVAALAA